MQGRVPIALLVLAAAAAGGLWLWNTDPAPAPIAAPGARDADAAVPDPLADAAPNGAASQAAATPADAPLRRADDETRPWVVRGTAKLGYAEPFAGARLVAKLFAGYEANGEPISRSEIVAAKDGGFAWPLPTPTRTVTVVVTSEVARTRVNRARALVVHGNPAPQDLEVRLFPLDHQIIGRVTDEAGEPIAGANVQSVIRTQGVFCDEDGRYAIDVSSATRTTLRAAAPGYAVQSRPVKLSDGDVTTADIALKPGLRVRGRVVDEAGEPVEGAAVKTFFTTFYKAMLTDADGRFELGYLEPGRADHSLFARKEGYIEARVQVETAALKDSYELVLRRGARVTGRVFGPDGKPVPGARLYIGFSPSAYNRIDAVSRDDGSFTFPTVAPGEHDLVTETRIAAADKQRFEIVEGQREATLRVDLVKGHFLGGRVVDTDGKPLEVGVHARTAGSDDRYIGEGIRSDADGRFRLEHLPEAVNVEFYGRNVLRKVAEGLAVDRDDHEIVLQYSAGLAGRVVDGRTGKPIERFTIRFAKTSTGGYGARWVRQGVAFEATDGYWNTENEQLQPGAEFVIEATADGYAPGRTPATAAIAPDRDAATIELRPGGTIEGRVLAQESGRPVEGATVVFFSPQRPRQDHNADGFHGRLSAMTDAEGSFHLGQVPAGEGSLQVESRTHSTTVDGPFAIREEQTVTRTIFLQPRTALTGHLVAPAGIDVAGIPITLSGNRVNAEATTDAQGRFEFKRALSAGTYLLRAPPLGDAPPFTVIGGVVELANGDLDVQLGPPGNCELVATLQSTEDLPPSLSVHLLRRDNAAQGITVLVGKTAGKLLHLRGIPAGEWRVTVHDFTGDAAWGGSAPSVLFDPARPARVTIEITRKPH